MTVRLPDRTVRVTADGGTEKEYFRTNTRERRGGKGTEASDAATCRTAKKIVCQYLYDGKEGGRGGGDRRSNENTENKEKNISQTIFETMDARKTQQPTELEIRSEIL